ncbi:MAG: mechanosensitive ion channel [Candidatus Eisenbacteria bacterium]|nr:mechanosensitive ion channel [Candidatus Eisenbacteria bacterium]
MDTQVADALTQAVPTWTQALRFLAILSLAGALHVGARYGFRRRPLHALLLRVSFPASVLLLTLVATLLRSPWGFREGAVFSDRVLAWNIFWIVFCLVRLLDGVIYHVHQRNREIPFPVPTLLRRILLGVLYLVAALAVLRTILGVNITPLLATSAILSMVIGLALQGVLGNLLAGISLNLVRTVETGNLIGIGDKEGKVVRTNWRETVIRTRDDDYVCIPNSVLASETIVNYSKPDQLHRHNIEVGASYSDAPADVIAALEEAAREASLTADTPPPVAYVVDYLDFGINYRLYFWSRNYWRKNPIRGEVARLIWYKFKRRGIEIPFPMSDQLLNDFMAVVYNQRRLPPPEESTEEAARVLASSAFLSRPPAVEGGTPERLLPEEAIGEFARGCRAVRYTKGEVLFRQGDAGEACYVVARGAVDGFIDYREGGEEHRFAFRTGPGEIIGEMSLFTGMPRTATGLFKEEAELIEIPREAFAKLLARHEEVAAEIARLVAARNEQNRAFLEKIASLSKEDLEVGCDEGRIIARLRNLAAWGRKLMKG